MQPESQQGWRQHIHDGKKRPARLPLPAAPALPWLCPAAGLTVLCSCSACECTQHRAAGAPTAPGRLIMLELLGISRGWGAPRSPMSSMGCPRLLGDSVVSATWLCLSAAITAHACGPPAAHGPPWDLVLLGAQRHSPQAAHLPSSFSMGYADNNVRVFLALAVGWGACSSRTDRSYRSQRLHVISRGFAKEATYVPFSFSPTHYQLWLLRAPQQHLQEWQRPLLPPFSFWYLFHSRTRLLSPIRARSPGRAHLPLPVPAGTHIHRFFFFKGQPSTRLSNWSPGLTFKLRPL